MRKILISSTALSVALSSFHTLPVYAQDDQGNVNQAECVPGDDQDCSADGNAGAADEEAAKRAAEEEAARAEAEAQAAAEAEAAAEAQAEADAQAAAEAEAAAKAQAEAEAAAEAQAQAEAEAQAEAQAQAEAEAAQAEARAAEEAAAAAAADAQAQAEAADKAAQEEAEAAARAADEAAAKATADAEAAAAEAAAAAEEAAKAATEAAEAAGEPVEEAETAAPAETDPAVTEAPADPAPEATTEAAPEAPAETTTETTTETPTEEAPAEAAATDDPAAEGDVADTLEPTDAVEAEVSPEDLANAIDTPVPEAEAVESLSGILAVPETADNAINGALAVPAVAAAAAFLDGSRANNEAGATEGEAPAGGEAAAPVSVLETIVTEDNARTSADEFAAAPVQVGKSKKSGLSDLEKVGLLALGALAVGTIIKGGNAQEERRVVTNSGDRVVVENPDGSYVVYKDDDAVLRRPGVRTQTESYSDGSTRTVVSRADGTQVVTIRDASGRVLRRAAYDQYGQELMLIDDLAPEQPIIVSELPKPRPDRVVISTSDQNAALKAEMAALETEGLGRKFSLRQVRDIPQVRALAATVEVDSITFDTGSSVINATEAKKLADLGRLMQQLLASNPGHVFLIEGHTDAVGSASSNLLLSDRRAESLALALTEYFGIPPENLVVQGYGEAELKIDTQSAERANRRVLVRLITPLLRNAG